jgi:hypothetical protein
MSGGMAAVAPVGQVTMEAPRVPPALLALRAALETATLVAVGWWAWEAGYGVMRPIAAALAVLALSATWGLFGTPGDPARRAWAPVAVPGAVRLIIELVAFVVAAWALSSLAGGVAGLAFAILATASVILGHRRVAWLLRR